MQFRLSGMLAPGASHDPAPRNVQDQRQEAILLASQVHAECHLRRRPSKAKMLPSDHLQGIKGILTDRKRSPARFCSFGKGKICGKSEEFARLLGLQPTLGIGSSSVASRPVINPREA
jgi:hypothetical protein